MNWLIGLALLFQTLDVMSSCQNLNSGLYKEVNPFLGNSCKSIIITKSVGLSAGYILASKKWVSIVAITSGAIGFTVNITFRK